MLGKKHRTLPCDHHDAGVEPALFYSITHRDETMKKLLGAATLAAFTISGHAALQNRDIDQDGVTDAFYDTDLNITWLRDANYAKTSGFDLDGMMNWTQANAWANHVVVKGIDGWRLPTTMVPDSSCGTGLDNMNRSFGSNCSGSEMGHLYYKELGNVYSSTNASSTWGDFLNGNTTYNYYWSSTIPADEPTSAYAFSFYRGHQGYGRMSTATNYSLLVHNGDVSPTPEPETYAMLLAGLGVMGAVARRRQSKQA